jgi:tripartite-type tricarboxylate transporter receptor subunit TctC
MKRIAAVTLGVGIAVLNGMANAASALPDKPIKIVVGAPPGGVNDTVARIVAEHMNPGQPVIVEDRNGASSMIAASYVARSAPYGATLLLASQTVTAVSPILNHVTSFDPTKDFRAVALFGSAPLVLIAEKNFSAHNVKELSVGQGKAGVPEFWIGWRGHVASYGGRDVLEDGGREHCQHSLPGRIGCYHRHPGRSRGVHVRECQ